MCVMEFQITKSDLKSHNLGLILYTIKNHVYIESLPTYPNLPKVIKM